MRTIVQLVEQEMAAAKAWLRSRMTRLVSEAKKAFNRALRGHNNCCDVSGNSKAISKFAWYVIHTCYRVLNRRIKKGWMKMDAFTRVWNNYIQPQRLKSGLQYGWKPKSV